MELFKLLGTIAVDNAKAKAAIDETTTKSQAMASKLSTFFGQIGSTYQKMFEGGKGKEAAKSFDEVSSATEKQRAKLDELKTEYKNLYMQQGKNSSETKKVAEEIEKLSKEISKNEEDLEEASKAADKYDKSIKDVGETAEKTESKLSKTFGAIGKGAAVAGKAIAAGLVAGTTAMAGLTVKALQLSGDLEQNMGGAEAVFGELGKTIADMETPMQRYDAATGKVITETSNLEKVSKEAYKNMGLSQSDYLATANKTGALFKGAGFETQEALDLSSSAMQRAADVASIMGIDTSAAMEAVAGAAKGNFTMMDNLGVAMNDTAIGAYALEKGINKSTSEMTQQEKIGLAMEMFMEKTAYAAGNYAKENETLAGSLGTAKSALTNFLAGSGDVDSLVSSFSNLANVVVNSLKEIAPRLTQGISDLVTQVAPMIAPLLQTLLPVLVEGATTLINGLVAALPGVISALLDALPMLIDGIMSIVDALIGALPTIIEAIVGALPTLIPQLIDAVVSLIMMLVEMLPQIIDPLIAALPTIIISIVEALVNNLPVLIEGFIQLFMGIVTALPQIFGSLISAIPAALSGIWDGIKNVFGGLGEWFGEKFKGAKDAAVKAWDGAKEKWNSIKEKCVEGFSDFKDKVKTKFSDAKQNAEQSWADAKQKWNSVKDKVVDGFSNLKDKVKTKFTEAKKNAESAWSDAKSKFSNVKDKVVSAFSDLGNKLKPLFTKAKNNATQTWSTVKGAFEKIKKGDIIGAFNDLGSLMKGKFQTALNTAKQGFSKAKSIGLDLVKGIGNGITSGVSWIKGKIKSFVGNVTSFIKKLFKIKSPSQVMRDEVGRELARGVAVGIEQNTDAATDAMEHLGKDVVATAQATIANEVSEIQKEAAEKTSEIQADLAKDTAKTQEELAKKTAAAQKKMADVSKDTTKKVAAANAKLNSEILKTAKSKLDAYKLYNTLTAESESQFWDEIRKQFAEGTEERIEADKLYFEARSSIDKELLDSAKKRLENYQVYNDMTLAEEAGFWDDLRQNFEEGTDARIEADKNYLAAKKSINEKILSAEETLQNELDGIAQRVPDRQKEILDKFGLFDKFDAENDQFDPATQMLLNLDADIKAMEKYNDMMDSLESRIGGTALFDELKNMGIDARGNILEVSKMTDAELAEFVRLYDEKAALARSMAEEDLAPQMVEDSQKAFDDFVTSCGDMGVEITSTLADYMATAEGTVLASLGTIAAAFSTFQLGTPNMDVSSLFNAPTISNGATVYSLKASTVGGVETESKNATSGTMSDVFASIVEQKNMMAKLLEMLGKFFPELIEAFDIDLFINGRQFAAELAPDMDAALGFLTSNKERGR